MPARYEPAIVSFIDILGFRALLTARAPQEIRDIILSLRDITAPAEALITGLSTRSRVISRAYADSVSDATVRVRVFATKIGDGAFFLELLDLVFIQIQCVRAGVLVRAGLAIGDAHVGPDGRGPIFGPAMARAVDIETKEAVYPRIVVDEAAYQQFLADSRLHKFGNEPEEEVARINDLLRIGEDGTRFVDYLAAGERAFDKFSSYLAFLEQHAELVRSNLIEGHPGAVRRKYVWLGHYHNTVIGEICTDFATGQRSWEVDDPWSAACLTSLRVEL